MKIQLVYPKGWLYAKRPFQHWSQAIDEAINPSTVVSMRIANEDIVFEPRYVGHRIQVLKLDSATIRMAATLWLTPSVKEVISTQMKLYG